MSGPPDEHNWNYGWVNKRNFQRDKALKEESGTGSPWSKEQWQAAAARHRAGVREPERRFPIIITSSQGPFTHPQKLQEIAGLSTVPDVHRTTKTTLRIREEDKKRMEIEGSKPEEEVQYCDVNWAQLLRVQEYSEGQEVVVWFQGKKRFAWVATSVKQKSASLTDAEKA